MADRRREAFHSTSAAWMLGGKSDGRNVRLIQLKGDALAASPDIGPMGPVRQFVAAFNANDVAGMQAACTESTSIIDDFPPYEWCGPYATTSWFREMARMASGYGMSEWSVTLGEPRHVNVADGHAYLAVSADVRWLKDEQPAERACLMTMSLREGAAGWRISSLAWAWS